jgi:Fe-S-cluster containining protein
MKETEIKASSKCARCNGKCCRYIIVDIPTPRSRIDFDNYGWYLAHKDTALYIDNGKWYLTVFNDCRYLGSDNKCQIYDNRFQACRDHSDNNCEVDGGEVADKVFRDPFELLEYADKKFRAINRKRNKTRKLKLLKKG